MINFYFIRFTGSSSGPIFRYDIKTTEQTQLFSGHTV